MFRRAGIQHINHPAVARVALGKDNDRAFVAKILELTLKFCLRTLVLCLGNFQSIINGITSTLYGCDGILELRFRESLRTRYTIETRVRSCDCIRKTRFCDIERSLQ